MNSFFERTATMLGESSVEKLNCSHVLVFGLGGVGGHAAETLLRAGIGKLSDLARPPQSTQSDAADA